MGMAIAFDRFVTDLETILHYCIQSLPVRSFDRPQPSFFALERHKSAAAAGRWPVHQFGGGGGASEASQ